jgi:hypothetical protein
MLVGNITHHVMLNFMRNSRLKCENAKQYEPNNCGTNHEKYDD